MSGGHLQEDRNAADNWKVHIEKVFNLIGLFWCVYQLNRAVIYLHPQTVLVPLLEGRLKGTRIWLFFCHYSVA